MKKLLSRAVLGASLFAGVLPLALAEWKTLSVNQTTQEHSQWCWAGTAKALLAYYGQSPSQCSIVNWAYGLNYACGNTTFDWNSPANQPNGMYGTPGSEQDILSHWGVSNSGYSYALSFSNLRSDVINNRPFVIRYGWTSGGGHIMGGYGYEIWNGVNYVFIMNPWPGEGNYEQDYNSVVSDTDHNWTHSLRMNR